MLQIGKLKLLTPVILAPMSGITSLPFRMLNRKFGCECCFLEMLNARSLNYMSKRSVEILRSEEGQRPLGVQLLGSNLYYILKALDKLAGYGFDLLDFNAACPRPKITRRGEGASLLRTPVKLYNLLKSIVKESLVPVTVKIRLGWDSASNAVDIALKLEDAGIDAIFVHGRTQVQGYSGSVDYEKIKNINDRIKIPLIASGDIFTPELAKKMFEETGCDGVLVARGALGNPWIFKNIQNFLNNGEISRGPSPEEIKETIKMHLNLCIDFYGEKTGVIKFRKFYIWYSRGFIKVKPLRLEVVRVNTKAEMIELIEKLDKLA